VSRTSVVLLSASFDGGWTVTVDGKPATPEMVAPALVGVTVSPGNHVVSFVYSAYPYYPELIALAIATALGFGFWPRLKRRLFARSPARDDESEPTDPPAVEASQGSVTGSSAVNEASV